MRRNMGITDRVFRMIIGVIILLAGLIAGSWWGLVGLFPLATGVVGFCPPYAFMGVDTTAVGSRPDEATRDGAARPRRWCC